MGCEAGVHADLHAAVVDGRRLRGQGVGCAARGG